MQLNEASTGNVPYVGDGSTGVDIGTNLISEHLTVCMLYLNHESFNFKRKKAYLHIKLEHVLEIIYTLCYSLRKQSKYLVGTG